MTEQMVHCRCGHTFPVEDNPEASPVCPECGAPVKGRTNGSDPAKRILTDSYIEAAYEVLAEEGAIWSGAR
ncbi:MAG: DUF3039 domain-containing protein [Deltaproteobacteria bacterium]|nr:DUF3039 domain-containing protein [Deltaproteobacteria bacterium]